MSPLQIYCVSSPTITVNSPEQRVKLSRLPVPCASETNSAFGSAVNSYHCTVETVFRVPSIFKRNPLSSLITSGVAFWLNFSKQVVPSFTERISSRGLSRALVMRHIVAKVGLLKSRSICERIDFETPDLTANCSKVRLCLSLSR